MIGTRRPAVLRYLGFGLGLALLAAAVYAAIVRIDPASLGAAQPWHLLTIAAGVVFNLATTTTIIWLITIGFDLTRPLRWRTMLHLVCAAHLLNYLPFWPGIVGRAAYLKQRFGLPLAQSGMILAVTLTIGGLVTFAVVGIAMIGSLAWRVGGGAILLALAMVLSGAVARRALRRPLPHAWLLVPLRILDLLGTAVRLWVAFRVVGYPIDFWTALVCAAVGSFIAMLGITPNGLGIREWGVALVSNLLVPDTLAIAGLAAAVDRGVEALVAMLAGVWSIRRLGLDE